MKSFNKPKIIISKCIEFESCRYNGLQISSDIVKKLKTHVQFSPVCPEVEIGLGTPRNPIRLVMVNGKTRLIQPATKADVTDNMESFTNSFMDSIDEFDGFILKSRSPSCGTKDVKIYLGGEKGMVTKRGKGFFAGSILDRFSHLAIEDEGRLTNFRIREHFLTKVFTLARFRQVKESKSMGELVRFQTENKLLFMAYNQKELRIMGNIVANHEKMHKEEVLKNYEHHLWSAFVSPSRHTSTINVLMHALGGFSKKLSSDEKSFFLNTLEEYRDERVPLSVPLGILKSWAVRFEDNYLLEQSFIQTYPHQLIEITDSGKGRDFRG